MNGFCFTRFFSCGLMGFVHDFVHEARLRASFDDFLLVLLQHDFNFAPNHPMTESGKEFRPVSLPQNITPALLIQKLKICHDKLAKGVKEWSENTQWGTPFVNCPR
ncbi:hypothetical protein QQP08_006168 [Theobroma cacao]|nr:hypothetical protein QQP08_006168 [Theobroma cacao]